MKTSSSSPSMAVGWVTPAHLASIFGYRRPWQFAPDASMKTWQSIAYPQTGGFWQYQMILNILTCIDRRYLPRCHAADLVYKADKCCFPLWVLKGCAIIPSGRCCLPFETCAHMLQGGRCAGGLSLLSSMYIAGTLAVAVATPLACLDAMAVLQCTLRASVVNSPSQHVSRFW